MGIIMNDNQNKFNVNLKIISKFTELYNLKQFSLSETNIDRQSVPFISNRQQIALQNTDKKLVVFLSDEISPSFIRDKFTVILSNNNAPVQASNYWLSNADYLFSIIDNLDYERYYDFIYDICELDKVFFGIEYKSLNEDYKFFYKDILMAKKHIIDKLKDDYSTEDLDIDSLVSVLTMAYLFKSQNLSDEQTLFLNKLYLECSNTNQYAIFSTYASSLSWDEEKTAKVYELIKKANLLPVCIYFILYTQKEPIKIDNYDIVNLYKQININIGDFFGITSALKIRLQLSFEDIALLYDSIKKQTKDKHKIEDNFLNITKHKEVVEEYIYYLQNKEFKKTNLLFFGLTPKIIHNEYNWDILSTFLFFEEFLSNPLYINPNGLCRKMSKMLLDKNPKWESQLKKIRNSNLTSYYGGVISSNNETNNFLSYFISNEIVFAKDSNIHIHRYSLSNFAKKLYQPNPDSPPQLLNIPSDEIFILSDLSEFIDDYNYIYKTKVNDNLNKLTIESIKNLLKNLKEYNKNTYIILEGNNNEIKSFLNINEEIKFLFQDNLIIADEISDDEIYNIYESLLPVNLRKNITEKFKDSFLDYLDLNKKFIPFSNKSLAIYLSDYSILNNSLVLPNMDVNEKSVSEELNSIIGLSKIKNKIFELENFVTFSQKAKSLGLSIPKTNYHMVFTGNPGTGKTTIARIVANLFYNIGLIKENKLVEVGRKDLVAEYVGQTAPKVDKIIKSALGGVLFIDEAYSLTQDGSHRDFGHEVVSTLIKAMEDEKDNLIVIFAGYKKEMEDFINSNSGISSRIGYNLDFEDYSTNELTEMYITKIKNSGFDLSEKATTKVKDIMEYFHNVENFGNGRFVDQLIQHTLIKHAQKDLNDKNFVQITENSIPDVGELIEIVSNRKHMIDPEELTEENIKRVAIHELGHAISEYLLEEKTYLKKISIKPQGNGALGYTMYENRNKYLNTEKSLTNEIIVLLSGKNAEKIYFKYHSDGCSNDFEKAVKLAKTMVSKFAMPSVSKSDYNRILKKADEKSLQLLQDNKNIFDKVLNLLLEKEELSREEFISVI